MQPFSLDSEASDKGKRICEYLRLSGTFAVEEITHDSPVGVARQESFARNTDAGQTEEGNTEEENCCDFC